MINECGTLVSRDNASTRNDAYEKRLRFNLLLPKRPRRNCFPRALLVPFSTIRLSKNASLLLMGFCSTVTLASHNFDNVGGGAEVQVKV
jgi:hypothetical protein